MVKGRASAVTAPTKRAPAATTGRRSAADAKINSPLTSTAGSTSYKPKAATALPSCGGCGIMITMWDHDHGQRKVPAV